MKTQIATKTVRWIETHYGWSASVIAKDIADAAKAEGSKVQEGSEECAVICTVTVVRLLGKEKE